MLGRLLEKCLHEGVKINWVMKTDLPLIDQWLSDPDYALQAKGKKVYITWMSPGEYLRKQAEAKGVSLQRDLLLADPESIAYHKEQMASGESVYALYLEPSRKSQEGKHRAIAAKGLGVDSVPVVMVEEA